MALEVSLQSKKEQYSHVYEYMNEAAKGLYSLKRSDFHYEMITPLKLDVQLTEDMSSDLEGPLMQLKVTAQNSISGAQVWLTIMDTIIKQIKLAIDSIVGLIVLASTNGNFALGALAGAVSSIITSLPTMLITNKVTKIIKKRQFKYIIELFLLEAIDSVNVLIKTLQDKISGESDQGKKDKLNFILKKTQDGKLRYMFNTLTNFINAYSDLTGFNNSGKGKTYMLAINCRDDFHFNQWNFVSRYKTILDILKIDFTYDDVNNIGVVEPIGVQSVLEANPN
jgi:hypothetical protein